ncbi:hypothetical protein Gotur_021434, partial [Gossypium turneri]
MKRSLQVIVLLILTTLITDITKVLGPERYGNQAQAEVQRLRDQIAQMQASIVEQIAQLKSEAASREAEAQRKYEELQL